MTDKELMQQALEALENCGGLTARDARQRVASITALRAALGDPGQEPVALDWLHKWANQDDGEPETQWHEGYEAARRVVQIHLTAPPQRKPPATIDEMFDRMDKAPRGVFFGHDPMTIWMEAWRAAEQHHGIKEGT